MFPRKVQASSTAGRLLHPGFHGQISSYLVGVGHRRHNIHEGRAITEGIDLAVHKFGVALVPQSADRFQRRGVLFKFQAARRQADQLIRIEAVLFARRDQMHGDLRAFADSALAELQPAKTPLP